MGLDGSTTFGVIVVLALTVIEEQLPYMYKKPGHLHPLSEVWAAPDILSEREPSLLP